MSYIAADGKRFPTTIQGRKYDEWLRTKNQAPGGLAHEEAFRLHGVARHIEIDVEDGGRYRVKTKHADGFRYEGVHPQAHVLHDAVGHLIGLNPPIAVETAQRAKNQSIGVKEDVRLAKEDHRIPDQEE